MEPKKGLADPLEKLERIIGLLKLVAGIRIETGNLVTPDGIPYRGFKVTIDDGLPPARLEYAREKINEVLGKTQENYKVTHHSNTNITIETR